MKESPRLQLRQQIQKDAGIWLLHLGIYIFAFGFVFTSPQTSIFWIEGREISPYVHLIFLMWLIVLLTHMGSLVLKYFNYRVILHEMRRNDELERLRLLRDLAQAKNVLQSRDQQKAYHSRHFVGKPKRRMKLTDDGELMPIKNNPRKLL